MNADNSKINITNSVENYDVQHSVIEFLSNPGTYGPKVKKVNRIDTHAAVIFLAGPHAYKIKRKLVLPYLDFSTLELRHLACLNELRINKLSAPEIYLDIVPVIKTDAGSFKLGMAGKVVEWVVKMNRFSQQDLLANLADQNLLHEGIVDQAIHQIISFQNQAPPIYHRDGARIIAETLSSIIQTFERQRYSLDFSQVRDFTRAVSRELALKAEYLRQRGNNGSIRRCHGDLHLANIVLVDGHPRLFDAIEFDENIACVDVLYDDAFFIMDLWYHNCRKLSNYALNQYFHLSNTPSVEHFLGTLPIFLACRAGVRGMVALNRASVIDPAEIQLLYDEATKYIELANGFLESDKPALIAVGGRSGSGKSTLARELAPMVGPPPGSILMRSDVYRKILQGREPLERLGSEAYTPEKTDDLYKYLLQRTDKVLQAGKSVIVDAAFLNPAHRLKFEELALSAKSRFYGFWLEAPRQVLTNRVNSRKNDASDADSTVLAKQLQLNSDPDNWAVFSTEGPIKHTISELAWKLKNEIGDNTGHIGSN